MPDREDLAQFGAQTFIKGYDPEEAVTEEVRIVDHHLWTMDYFTNVAIGLVPGHSAITIIGRNPDIDNVMEDVWEVGGSYVFPPDTGMQMKIKSSSANDAGAGTGARTVDVHYLRVGFIEGSEMITLNGVTAVNTVATDIIRINNIHVMSVGSGGITAGNLSLTDFATGLITYGYISAGINVSRQAIYTIPCRMARHFTSSVGTFTKALHRGHILQKLCFGQRLLLQMNCYPAYSM